MFGNRTVRLYVIIDRENGEIIQSFRDRDELEYFISDRLRIEPHDVYNGNSQFIIQQDERHIPISPEEVEYNNRMKKMKNRNSSIDDLLSSK